jgi:uncharacterized protein YgiB involved in biofilm formation
MRPSVTRKRSRAITFLSLGGVALLGLGIAASSSDATEDVKVYKSVDECAADSNDRADCEVQQTAARLSHEDDAPRFADEASCSQEYGNCTAVIGTSGSPSWFMPAMGGFVLGRLIGQPAAQPVFYDRRGYAYIRNLPPDKRTDDVVVSGGSSFLHYGGGGGGSTATSVAAAHAVASSSGGYSRVSKGGSSGSVSVSRGGFGGSGHSASS